MNEKTLASTGLILLYPVTIAGRHYRLNGIPHHTTIRFFDKPGITIDDAHDYASQQDLKPINPHEVYVTPNVYPNRFGGKVHVLTLSGSGVDHIKQAHKAGSHLALPPAYKGEFSPHISIDEDLHNEISSLQGPIKASDLGIEFHPPELRLGEKTIAHYSHIEKNMMSGLNSGSNYLAKSSKIMEHAARAATVLGLLAGPTMSELPKPATSEIPKTVRVPENLQKQKILNTISFVESGNKPNPNHAVLGGIHAGERAFGFYGLTPVLIREYIQKNPKLEAYKAAVSLKGEQFHNFMKQNRGLEKKVAQIHLDRLYKIFNGDIGKIGHAWLSGMHGTLRAERKGIDINNHWHVKKIKNTYKKLYGNPTESSLKIPNPSSIKSNKLL